MCLSKSPETPTKSANIAKSPTKTIGSAEEGTRTPTAFRPPAPKAGASANSATSAAKPHYNIAPKFSGGGRREGGPYRRLGCFVCACRAGTLFVSLRGTWPACCKLTSGGTPCHIAQNAGRQLRITLDSVLVAARRKRPPDRPRLRASRTQLRTQRRGWPKM